MGLELSREEREHIYISLSVRIGFIETGTINRAKDLINCGKSREVKQLTTEQTTLIKELEDLMSRVLEL